MSVPSDSTSSVSSSSTAASVSSTQATDPGVTAAAAAGIPAATTFGGTLAGLQNLSPQVYNTLMQGIAQQIVMQIGQFQQQALRRQQREDRRATSG